MLTVTDLFAGAGGSSTGMIQVPGVHVRYAANHWHKAVAIHNANHPDTHHAAVDLHLEDPRFFARTDILWASPECTKWSQANGSNLPAIEEGLFEDPLSADAANRSRLLMFDVLKFIEHHQYRAVIVENVVDIATQAKYKLAWYEWRVRLRALGYKFQVVSLNAMHAQWLGAPAPQSRDRIFIVAWPEREKAPDLQRALRPKAYCPKCDVVVQGVQSWKNGKTVGRYRQTYLFTHTACGTVVEPGWLPAAAAIDWSNLGARIGSRLAAKTRARIAAGIARYWGPMTTEGAGNTYDAADPKHRQHGDPNGYYRTWPVGEPLRALHTSMSKALAVPMEGRDGKEARQLDGPLRTQTTRLETGLVTPAGGTWNEDARPTDEALRTLQTREAYGLAQAPFVSEMYGTAIGRPVSEPAATFTAGGMHHALVQSYYGNAGEGRPVTDPMGTLTTHDRHALVHRHNNNRGDSAAMTTPAFEPLRTLTTAGHQSVLRPPRRQVTEADMRRAEEILPEVYFRMFTPLEVAAGMAFPEDYDWHPDPLHPTSNRDLTKAAGNAVCPPAARDLMAAVVESITGEAVAA